MASQIELTARDLARVGQEATALAGALARKVADVVGSHPEDAEGSEISQRAHELAGGDVLGDLDPRLDATFDGSASAPSGPYTELTGYVRDQAQFMGMIGQVADLGLDLVSASVCPCVDGERCEHLGEGLRPAEDHN